jgi:hypothetical protein
MGTPMDLRRLWFNLRAVPTFLRLLPGGLRAVQARAQALEAQLTTIESRTRKSDRQLLYENVGRALSAWAQMEELLVALLALILRVNGQQAGLILYSIFNFQTWITIIQDLFDMEPELTKQCSRFNKISERLRKIKDTRDQLAHHAVKSREPLSAVSPSRLDARTKSKKFQPLSNKEVTDFTEAVLDIADDLQALIASVQGALSSSREKSS